MPTAPELGKLSKSPPQHRSALRLPQVIERTRLSRASIYRLVRRGRFPTPCRLSERVTVWDATEIDAWLAAQFARRAS